MAMIAPLYTMPLIAGGILLAFGLYSKESWLRACGDGLLVIACVLVILQFHMIKEHTSWVEYGLFLDSWSDYLGFAGIVLVGGLLAADGIVQILPKKSSSS